MNNNDNEKKLLHEEHHNCCGHDHEHCDHSMEEELETIILTLDDDRELECAVLGVFDVDAKDYIALVTLDDEQVLLYEYVTISEEEFDLKNIDSEEEFEKVSEAFYDIYVDEDSFDENE